MSFDFDLPMKDLPNNLISSRVTKPETVMKIKKPRYLLTSDNFRGLVQRISPDHPDFTIDTFQILQWWTVGDAPPSKDIEEVKALIKKGIDIIEFRYGSYTLESVWLRKKK